MASSANVRVIMRVRPLNEKERTMDKYAFSFRSLCVQFNSSNKSEITVLSAVEKGEHKFNFDYVCDSNSQQEKVYEVAGKPIVDNVIDGFNGTILAYGQTSSGKTYTMQGDIDNDKMKGIIPRIVTQLFDKINETPDTVEFTVKVSIVEIYNEKIKDLLNPNSANLKVADDKVKGIILQGCTEEYVTSQTDVYNLMKKGNSNRAIGVTDMNAQSSRSHSIVIFSIRINDTANFSCKVGKLFLVDLAGSEKVGKTNATGQTLNEAKNINKSLTMLGRVINSLTENATHIPYRDSKLTRLLQDSLGGNSKTCLIITASPSSYNAEETLSTCRFGTRAKSIKNNAVVNKEYTIAELKLMIQKLEKDLEKKSRTINMYMKLLVENGISLPSEEKFFQNQITNDGDIAAKEEKDGKEEQRITASVQMLNDELIKEKEKYKNKKNKIELLKQDQALKASTIKTFMKQQEDYIKQIADMQIEILEFQKYKEDYKKNLDSMKKIQEQLETQIKLFSTSQVNDIIQSNGAKPIPTQINEKMDAFQQIISQQSKKLKIDAELQMRKKTNSIQEVNECDKELKKKITSLERNVAYLQQLYTQTNGKVSEQNLKLQYSIKKEEKKQKRIQEMEEELKMCTEQIISLKAYQNVLMERLSKHEKLEDIPKFVSCASIIHKAQCIKPIKGGLKSSILLTTECQS